MPECAPERYRERSAMGQGPTALWLTWQLFQHPAQNLSRRRLRNRVNHLEVANLLIAGHSLRDESRERVEVNCPACARHDKGFRSFARIRIRHPCNAAILYVRVLQHYSFEFRRGNTEALVFDHLLFAVDDVDKALVVHPADVASVKPAIAQGARGLFRRVPVTLHDLRASHNYLAGLARRQIEFAGLDIDDPELGVSQQHAAAFGFDAIQWSLMRGGAGFGQAVSLDNAKAEASFHAASHVGRERRRRAECVLDRSELRGIQPP